MALNEYDIGSRNVHHHPLMRSTDIDVPGNAIEFIDSGNVGMHDDGFHLDPPTQFEYSQTNRNDYDNEETIVITKQTVDMVVEAGLKANLSFPKIKEFLECLGSCSPVSNGTSKEGKNRKAVKLDKSQDYEEYPDDKGVDRFKDSIIDRGLKLGLAFSDIKNILEVADSGNPSLNHSYPYESQGHVDAKAAIKTPWPQGHAGSGTEPKPGAEQEFRSPTKGKDGYVQDAKDPGKGHTPQMESIIRKSLDMGLSFPEVKKVLEDIQSKHDGKYGAGANEDRNEEKDTDNSPEAAEDDVKRGKNTQIGEKTKKVKGGYENIGKKKNGSKKHGIVSKKKADAQRGAMFANRKPGASWGK
jgi:hypothetical protein